MAYTPLAEAESFDPEKEKELYASLYPTAGVAVNPETGNAVNPEQQGLLEQSREAEEAEAEQQQARSAGGMSPGLASVLGAAGSMLRTSGWQSQPLSYAQRLGYAIPAGMQAYYQQGAYNQEAEKADQEAQKLQLDADNAKENREAFHQYLATSGLSSGWIDLYTGWYDTNPDGTWTKLQAHIKEKLKKKKDPKFSYHSREEIQEDPELAHLKKFLPAMKEGQWLKEDKESGEHKVVNKNLESLSDKEPAKKWSMPYVLGNNWVQRNLEDDNEIRKIGAVEDKVSDSDTVDILTGTQLVEKKLAKEVGKPGAYYKVTYKSDGTIRNIEEFQEAIVAHTDKDLIGQYGISTPEATKLLTALGLQKHQDASYLRSTTDKWGNRTITQYAENGMTIAENTKYGEQSRQYNDTLEQRKKEFNANFRLDKQKFVQQLVAFGHKKGWDDAIRPLKMKEAELRINQMEKNLEKGFSYHSVDDFLLTDQGKIWTKDELLKHFPDVKSIEVDPDGKLKFLDVSGNPNRENNRIIDIVEKETIIGDDGKKTEVMLSNKYMIDKDGNQIKKLGMSEVPFADRPEVMKMNLERQKEVEQKQRIMQLISNLGDVFGYDANHLVALKLQADANPDSTLDELQKIYRQERDKDSSLVTGAQLLRRFCPQSNDTDKQECKLNGRGKGFDQEGLYRKVGDSYELFDPSSKTYGDQNSIRKDWNSLTRDQIIAARGYNGIMTVLNQNNGLGDIMAITSFRIMFEPNSVVRETEFAITAKAQGMFSQAKALLDRLKEGDLLGPEGRKQMKKIVTDYMKGAAEYLKPKYQQYSRLAKERGYDVETIIQHPFAQWGEKGQKNNWAAEWVQNRGTGFTPYTRPTDAPPPPGQGKSKVSDEDYDAYIKKFQKTNS